MTDFAASATPSESRTPTGPALAALLALGALGLSLGVLTSHPLARSGAWLGGITALVLSATTLWLRARGGATTTAAATEPTNSSSALLSLLAFFAASVAVAIHAGLAIPEDLNLFTLGRPPQALFLYGSIVSAIAIDGVRAASRGMAPRAMFVPLLLATLTLEGLPLATPPWLLLLVSAIAWLVGSSASTPPRTPTSRRVEFATFVLAGVFVLCGALGADPGTSLDPAQRMAALALAASTIVNTGEPGARRAVGTLLLAAVALGLFALLTKILLASATRGLDIDVLGSELSLFGRHPNSLAPWFGATAILALAATRVGSKSFRTLAGLALVAALGALLLTSSRLAIAATAATALIGVALRTRAGRRGFAIAATLGAAATIVALATLAISPLRAKLTETIDAAQSVDHREFRMRVGLAAALEEPLLGRGPLCWFTQGAVTPRSQFEGESSSDHPHSLPIALFQGTGALGLLVFLFFLTAYGLAARQYFASGPPLDDPPLDDAARQRRILAQGVVLASIVQLSTNLLDMGDALVTLVPSRLPIDAAILVALGAAPAVPMIGSRVGATLRTLLVGAIGCVALYCGLARYEADAARELARQGFDDRALLAFEGAVGRLPFDVDLRLDHARLAFHSQKRVVARDSLEHAARLAPGRADVFESIAGLRLKLDDRSGAREAARRALELDPHGATIRRIGLLVAELDLDAKDEAAALEVLGRTVRNDATAFRYSLDPKQPGMLRLGPHVIPLTRVYASLRESATSGLSTREAMRVDLRIFELALGANDLPTAEAALLDYRKHEPGAISIDKFEGRLLAAQGRHEESLAAFDRAVARLADPGLIADRGDALLKLGRIDEALAAYRSALPTSRDVYFHAYAYHSALDRLALALEGSAASSSEELERTLRSLVFFIAADSDRAVALIRLSKSISDLRARREVLLAALRATLRCDDSPAIRKLASELGGALAATGKDLKNPSGFADDLERVALDRHAGAATHVFRAALLLGLGLERRAADAERDVLAFRR